ncbi:dTDP-4-dehydrorhamnose reductase [Achromobacter denitrificans]|uniref:dTDP-4-dehydrorhamnose reductase n=1 Tax=Achromobacter denitrificans TaxID=32002 RepID=UPI000F6720C1|nr:dTDP-4-dehydrorhamnose reductase [Achromobacter denitrificans]RSE89139.1 dTDP-4-dehydrorhamnose reductase [Achromobacter denitrificans]
MKILLLGKNGQVGHELQRTLLPLGELVALDRHGGDLANVQQLRAVLEAQSPDVIVNAAAYTAVDKAESDAAAARAINTDAVATLAQYARDRAALLVHYSTDYVFDGTKSTPYETNDPTNPQSVYGTTKRDGERAILEAGCPALILRTSWVFSAHGGNFVKTILRLAKERDSLGIVADQHGAPTSAELIADVSAHAIVGKLQGSLQDGIYHLTASGETTWHGLAQHVVARAQRQGAALRASAETIRPIATQDYPLPAVRPKNSRLDTRALTGPLKLQLPDWTAYVDRTVDQLMSLEQSA